MNPRVTVLILTYNGKHLLDDSISSYLTQDYDNYEVCIVDNGSKDNTVEYVREKYPEVTILRTEKNLGYSGGLNFGMKYAFEEKKSDFVLITNNDVKADRKVISELVKVAIVDEKNGFVTGKVYYYDNPNVLQTVGKQYHPVRWNGGHIGSGEIDNGQYDKIEERYFSDDIYTLVRKNLYEEVGGYDTDFKFQGEEYDWQARAKAKGYRIMYTPYAKIWHKESMTIGKSSAFKLFYDSRNPMLVILKHKSPDYFRKFFWLHFKRDIIRTSLVVLRRLRIFVFFSIWAGFFSGIFWGIRKGKFTFRHFIKF